MPETDLRKLASQAQAGAGQLGQQQSQPGSAAELLALTGGLLQPEQSDQSHERVEKEQPATGHAKTAQGRGDGHQEPEQGQAQQRAMGQAAKAPAGQAEQPQAGNPGDAHVQADFVEAGGEIRHPWQEVSEQTDRIQDQHPGHAFIAIASLGIFGQQTDG